MKILINFSDLRSLKPDNGQHVVFSYALIRLVNEIYNAYLRNRYFKDIN